MTRGILQFATSGNLVLHLEYRVLATPLQEFRPDAEDFEPTDPGNIPFMTGSFEATYGEY
jgi:hypothetical protein